MDRVEDVTLRQELLAELRWEMGETAAGVEVAVDGGLVVLSGRVDTSERRRRAVGAALRTPGVTDVVDGIGVVVSGSRIGPDAALARRARAAFRDDSFAPEERIKTVVSGGWVTLHGSVDHLADASDAESVVRHLDGARGATNLVEVGWLGSDSAALRRAIEASSSARLAMRF